MKAVCFTILAALLLLADNGVCQISQAASGKYFSKIVIHAGDSMFVATDTLLVDTLVMHDRARLKFLHP
ncbi:MAG TPA: hypothetical protein VG737_08810, partial [Cyclobacteriaceae bacterium]|nr:hypothetical protein [Cyclobacteriaceae bacterium]